MEKLARFTALILIIGSTCFSQTPKLFPGTIHLPPGYRIEAGQGSVALVGLITNGSGVNIHYTAGPVSGNITRKAPLNYDIEGEYQRQETRSRSHPVTIVYVRVSKSAERELARHDPGLKRVLISFNDVCANFNAYFHANAEAKKIVDIVLSFTPSPSLTCKLPKLPKK